MKPTNYCFLQHDSKHVAPCYFFKLVGSKKTQTSSYLHNFGECTFDVNAFQYPTQGKRGGFNLRTYIYFSKEAKLQSSLQGRHFSKNKRTVKLNVAKVMFKNVWFIQPVLKYMVILLNGSSNTFLIIMWIVVSSNWNGASTVNEIELARLPVDIC